MKKNFWNKKIPTIIGILLLVILFVVVIFFVQKKQFLAEKINPGIVPQEIQISNISSQGFTVSWITKQKTKGFLEYGVVPSLGKTVDAPQGNSQIHFVEMKNLSPKTNYYFKIGSNFKDNRKSYGNQGQPYTVVTGPLLTQQPVETIVQGKIMNPDNSPAENVLVVLTAEGLTPLSCLTDEKGDWLLDLGQARTATLTSFAAIEGSTILKINVRSGEHKTSAVISAEKAFLKVPSLVLEHPHYDFTEEMELPQQMPAAPSENEIIIINPSEAGEEINTDKPLFKGQGPPGQTIKVTVNSDPAYTTEIEIDDNGDWEFTVPESLDPGRHSLEISFQDESGEQETVSRNFVILSAGESDLPAITATSSGATVTSSPLATVLPSPTVFVAISPAPAETLFPTINPEIVLPTPPAQMPNAGITFPTIFASFLGIAMIAAGFIF